MQGILKSKGVDIGSDVRLILEQKYKAFEAEAREKSMNDNKKILHLVLFDFLKDVDRDDLIKHNVSVEQVEAYITHWINKNLREREVKNGNVPRGDS